MQQDRNVVKCIPYLFMKWDGTWYPCCGCRVRTKPRNSKFKQKLKITTKVQHLLLLFYEKNDVTTLFVN
jgi:hypothetical protein